MTVLRCHRAGRGLVAAALSAATCASLLAAAPSASADALDDGQWWRAAMGVDELNRSGAGQGVTVALIDGPLDSSVPELKGRVASSTTECVAPGGGLRPATVRGAAADHATRMASLIVGSGKGTASGGRGIAGIAPRATLRHYAVTFPSDTDPEDLSCGLKDASISVVGEATARAIRQAVKDGAKVISISLTTDYSAEFAPALLEAYRAGTIVVASTNNDTRKVFWPGIGNGVVTVTHVDAAGNLDDSAMRKSDFVDFAAPGTKVAAGAWTPSGWRSDVISDGSSQATAITAGGLAAVWSAHPDATGNQVLQAAKDAIGLRAKDGKYFTWFRRVGSNLPKASGKTESYGFGIAAPADAVKLDVESLPDTNPMVVDDSLAEPTIQEIAAATSQTSVSAGPSASTSSISSATPSTEGAATSDKAPQSGSGSGILWPVLAGLAILVVGGAAFLVRRRSAASAGPAAPTLTPDSHANDTNLNDTHDTQAAADGAAATTKEHSHGQN
ncbi:S8/S53 family peptidase [Janibacter sp. HTCC2649]|uniref:S8/S53 family peptidase n=1 Tax=Janibacter sp. HTCC2649 TaxID=313589 RepID=UPI00032609B2|nr:S8/S53 family peptidase [Janibacter sp. HTCC2649]